MTTACPLCFSEDNQALETVSLDLLASFYKKQFNIELDKDLRETIELRVCENCDLRFYARAFPGTERLYESLQRFDWYYLAEKQEYDIAAAHISRRDSVLEIGAGRGAFAKKIQPQSYVGLELSESAVTMARQEGLCVYKTSIDEHAALCQGCYDVVCSFQVLEHVADTRGFLDAALSCLRSRGRFIHSVPSEDAFIGYATNNILNMPPHHLTRWTDKALCKLAELLSLDIIEIRHDSLSDLHLHAYSVASIQKVLNKISWRKPRTLDWAFSSVLAKSIVALMSIPLEAALRVGMPRPLGHSVTAVYRKP
jgi:2-polyprenyl-3-methyl-5-hydroxy-6-metoxy-1,4-benzoquinol methylase